jgi:IS30 family transposase
MDGLFTPYRYHQAIVILTERKLRFALQCKVEQRRIEQVVDVLLDLLLPYAQRVHTITADDGKEISEHERIAEELVIEFYFIHPYAAWELGINEIVNVLVRLYI